MAIVLRSRFEGALVGAVVGDCLGNYWELKSWKGTHDIDQVRLKISEQVSEYTTGKSPKVGYTDDSAMTLEMAKSLVECKKLNLKNMTKRFTEEFYTSPERGYGAAVTSVFIKLKNSEYQDPFGPAQQQFKGQGSCGNGAAMRVSPAALYGYKDNKILLETARDSSRITHAHISGINGALLQALAVKQAMEATSTETLDVCKFIENLYENLKEFERSLDTVTEDDEARDEELSQCSFILPQVDSPIDPKSIKVKLLDGQPRYTSLLEQVRALLIHPNSPSADDVQKLLGHGVLSAEAVPCALYAFLHCSNRSFQELIPYAISLGGDTDTIASMAGAIGGAYWGYEAIPKEWVESCEGTDHAHSLAGELYKLIV